MRPETGKGAENRHNEIEQWVRGGPHRQCGKEMAYAVGGAVVAERATEQMAVGGLGQQRRNSRPAGCHHEASHARGQIRAEPQARFGAESTSSCVVRDGTFYDARSATD